MEGIKLIWPAMLGMALARAGLIVAGYGSYHSTDEGLFTDGAMLLALLFMLILFVILDSSKANISKRARRVLFYSCFAVQMFCLVALTPDRFLAFPAWTRMPLCALTTFGASGCMFFWLLHMARSGGLLATLFAFGSLIISELMIFTSYELGPNGYYVVAILVLAQPLLRVVWDKTHDPKEPLGKDRSHEFVGFARDMLANNKLLCIAGLGIGLLFFVDGLLRGYPVGAPIAFTPPTRLANMLLTIALSLGVIVTVGTRAIKPINSATFIMLELLAAAALLLYALMPDALEIGAVFTTTLNAMLCALMWYSVIAFMTFGWRDPYYYALGSWIVCMGSRAIARVLLTVLAPSLSAEPMINTIMGVILLVSSQVLLYGFFSVARDAALQTAEESELKTAELEREICELQKKLVDSELVEHPINCAGCNVCKLPEAAPKQAPVKKIVSESAFSRIMGLDKSVLGESSPQETMRVRAQQVGEQFMLSAREVEVLSYYAMGWTQKRVAEELYIQPATVHAHIKRIYAKTDLHSRQEILDFMEQYCA